MSQKVERQIFGLYGDVMQTKINARLKEMTTPELIMFTQKLVFSLVGNPQFLSPVPPLAIISSYMNSLEEAYRNAMGEDAIANAELNIARADLELALIKLYESVKKNDEKTNVLKEFDELV